MSKHASPKKRSKPYVAKAPTKYGGLHIIAGQMDAANPISEEERITVAADYYASISAMVEGRGEKDHYDSIAYALNIGHMVTRAIMGAEYRDTVAKAMMAAAICMERYKEIGRLGLAGDEIAALREYGPIFEEILKEATKGELKAAQDAAKKKIDKREFFEIERVA